MAQQKEPGKQKPMSPEEAQYRHRMAVKEAKRKQRTKQQLILVGAFVVFIAILIAVIVLVVQAIKGGGAKPARQSSSISADSSAAAPGITWPVAPDPSVWNLLLINNQVPMAAGFEPELAPVTPAGHMFDARAADALKQMVADCNAVEGANHSLAIVSAYRGETTQNNKYNDLVDKFKAQAKAEGKSDEEAIAWADQQARQIEPPFGYSDHQTGLAVDFAVGGNAAADDSFASTDEYIWLLANAPNYGFVLRFPESKVLITGILPQPYHFRYVGVDDAKIISAAGICLEEYLTKVPVITPVASALPTGPEGQTSVA